MRKLLLTLGFAALCSAVIPGCGGDDEDGVENPVTACKKLSGVLCKKIFNCFDEATLDALASEFGVNSSECQTKLNAESCTEDDAKCDAGETYSASQAQGCLDGYEDYSCDNIEGLFEGTTPAPAACDLVCRSE